MTEHLSRREFLRRSAGVAAGTAALSLLHPAVSLAQSTVSAEDLVDAGDTFHRGIGRGVAVVAAPDGAVLEAAAAESVFTSAALSSSMKFTHVGLHWAASVPPGANLDFEIRTSADGANWSSWRAVKAGCPLGKTADGETFASLVYVRDARHVQYRATFRPNGQASPRVRQVTATVIDSPIVEAVAATQLQSVTVTDSDSGRSLAVTSREQWGADESYRFSRRNHEIWPEMFVPTKKLVVHHTATRNDYQTAAEAAAEVRAIYQYHAVTQRWGDIGYCALIDKFGNIYEGRHGRGGDSGDPLANREVLSTDVVAGHDFAHNYGSIGVALLGDGTLGDWPMPAGSGPMWDALVRYCMFEAGRNFLRPLAANGNPAASDFLRSDDVWTDGMRNVSGHQETNSTLCPGAVVMDLLDDLRSAIHAGLTDVSQTGVALTNVTPGGRETTANTPIGYTWTAETPASGWTLKGYEYCVEGWQRQSRSEDITYLSGYTAETQPNQQWIGVGTTTATEFTPTEAGHYTFHVRAMLQNGVGVRRSAYAANHTFLVKSGERGKGGGKKPKQ